MLKRTVASFLAFCLALGANICLCSESDDHSAHGVTGTQSPASLDASQGHGGVVTAALAHSHGDEDECDHTALGTAVAKRGKSPVPTAPALSCRASAQWPAPGDIGPPSIAGAGDCARHHWLISVRSIVLLL